MKSTQTTLKVRAAKAGQNLGRLLGIFPTFELIWVYLLFFTLSTLSLTAIPSGKDTSKEAVFNSILSERHSGYSYDSFKNVPNKYFKKLAACASKAPSSYNEQPWRYIFCDRSTTPYAYKLAFGALSLQNQEWAKNAPVLIVVATKQNFTQGGSHNSVAEYDTGAASMTLVLEATALGLMAHQMAGFDHEAIRSLFLIPAGFEPVAMIALGYEAEGSNAKSPTRNPIGENFFIGEWGKGL